MSQPLYRLNKQPLCSAAVHFWYRLLPPLQHPAAPPVVRIRPVFVFGSEGVFKSVYIRMLAQRITATPLTRP